MPGVITNSRPCVITPAPGGGGSYQSVIGLRETEETDHPNEPKLAIEPQ